MALELSETRDRHARPGDLGAGLVDGRLLLPHDVFEVLRSQGIRTAEELVSYLIAFPSSLASVLHWDLPDVSAAGEKLKATLQGNVREELFQVPSPSRRTFGARDPAILGARRR